jgi:cellulose synthase/poly-beta-1,6-N-acetylglucosamine synthase-like glycosyltransferase
VYRTELLDQVLVEKTPYIVDDTFWVLETQRRNLGRIVYVSDAHALLQDPTNFKDWYKQTLRWMWGTFQGVIGHQVGRRATKFDFAYVLLILQWIVYVLSAPVAIVVLAISAVYAPWMLLVYMAGYGIWVTAAAIELRNPRLPLFIPAIIVSDFIYRFVFVHAFIKACKTPTVENCVWESPARIQRVA